jgi:hypothetical protein
VAEAQVSRSVRLLASLSAGTCVLLAGVAGHAQGVDDFGGYGTRRGERSESKQEAAFELRLGRYVPEVDSQVGGDPFQNTFGGSTRYLIGAEVDWQLLRIPHFGTLAPGLGWGYTKFTAKARYADGSGTSSSKTRLNIMPMYLVGVVRADVLPRDLSIPLVPYAKLGVGYGMWWSSDGQRSAEYQGKKGRGASYGLTYALGAMFLLDVLSEDDAKSADGITGINNSYIFAEWFRPQLDGFGSNKVLDISSSSWLLGIALEI